MSMNTPLTVGILALQGAFAKHEEVLHSLKALTVQVRKPEDLLRCDGLIIPGGESTTILKQIRFIEFLEPLLEFAKKKPIFGTCAGLILMSKNVLNFPMDPFGILDVTVERNGYGRQIESFSTELELPTLMGMTRALFIRAPKIVKWGPDVQILATYGKDPAFVQQGHHLGATFHAELTSDSIIHEYFLSILSNLKNRF